MKQKQNAQMLDFARFLQQSLAAAASVVDSAAVMAAAELVAAFLEVEEDIEQDIDSQPSDELGSAQKQVTFQLGESGEI